jgi:hypothetical protein
MVYGLRFIVYGLFKTHLYIYEYVYVYSTPSMYILHILYR